MSVADFINSVTSPTSTTLLSGYAIKAYVDSSVSGIGNRVLPPVATQSALKAVNILNATDTPQGCLINWESDGLYKLDRTLTSLSITGVVYPDTNTGSSPYCGWVKMFTPISEHNLLTGRQGGSESESYHLTLSQYNKATSLAGSTDGLMSLDDKIKLDKLLLDTEGNIQKADATHDGLMSKEDYALLHTTNTDSGAVTTSDIKVVGVTIGSYTDGNIIPAGTGLEYIITRMLQNIPVVTFTNSVLNNTLSVNTYINKYNYALELNRYVRAYVTNNDNLSSKIVYYYGIKHYDNTYEYKTNVTYNLGEDSLLSFNLTNNYLNHLDLGASSISSINGDTWQNIRVLFKTTIPEYTSIKQNALGESFSHTFTETILETEHRFIETYPYYYGCNNSLSTYLNPTKGQVFTMIIPSGTTKIEIIIPSYLSGLTSIKYQEWNNNDVLSSFIKETKTWNGTNNLSGDNYDYYTYTSGTPFTSDVHYIVTI